MINTISRVTALLVAATTSGSFGAEVAGQRYAVSILSPKAVASDERVTQFELDVVAGALRSVSGLPVGWYIVIENGASWQTKIKANATVGAAFITTKDLNGLRFVLDKNEFGDLKFAISGALSVTKSTTERLIRLGTGDFKVAPER